MVRRIVLLVITLAGLVFAQEFRSTLTGRVTDPSGAVVPNAKITAVKTDTNGRFETVSNSDGFYTIPLLPPGPYRIEAEASGFKTYSQSGIDLGANQRIARDIRLEVGSATESVTVTAEAATLESVTASSGQVISTREVESVPINGRAPMDLAFLAFGVVTNGNRDQNRPYENAGFSAFAMGGAANGANEALMDGVPNTGTLGTTGRRAAFSAPVDAVSEVKVETFNVDASYGGAGGGTVNIISKSGTNDLHGALSEFNQTSSLAATPFFTNKSGGKKTVSRQNQWTVTAGGPVFIPKVIDGRDKAFWFFAYEGQRNSEPLPTYTSTPTLAQRAGDFSGASYTIYDPSTGKLSSGKVTRNPFPNNQIPASRFSQVGLNILDSMPDPNFDSGKADGSNNYFAALTTANHYHSFLSRGDVNISDANKLTINMRTSLWNQHNSTAYQNNTGGESAYRSIWGGMIDDVHTFSPTVLANFRYGYNRYQAYYVQDTFGFDPTSLGFPSYMTSNANQLVFPRLNFSDGYYSLGNGHFVNQPYDTHQLLGTVTKIAGGHTIKVGTEFRMLRYSNFNWSGATGNFTFDSTWVKQTSSSSSLPLGGSVASLLLGLPTSGNYAINAASSFQSFYSVLFFQDDWHVKSNLTLNLGLRWEYNSPTTERWNRQTAGFDSTAVNSVTAIAKANYAANPISQLAASDFNPAGGLLFVTPENRTAYTTPKTSFSPRFGISWTPGALGGKTVFRSGVGIFDYNYGLISGQQQGFTGTTTFVPSNDGYLTPAALIDNPFPGGITQPAGSSEGVDTYLGQAANFNNPDLARMYSLRWNFDIQHQLARDTVLEVGYIGNHSVHLTNSYNYGTMPASFLSTSLARDQAKIDELAKLVSNPFAGLLPGTSYNGDTISVANLLRMYPEFSGVTGSNVNSGGSYFHMIAVKLQKRFTNGLQLVANYNHSRLMERNSYLNSGSMELEKRVSSSDRPNSFSLMGSYDLPVGRGKRYLSNSNAWINGFLGNWSVASIYSYASGAPLSWGNLLYYGGDLNYNSRNVDGAFNTSVFNTNSKQQLSQNYRYFGTYFNSLRVSGTNNLNITVSKKFNLTEGIKLEYRAESFNVCNHTQFSSPNLTATSSSFGTITGATNTPRLIQMALRLTF